MKLLFDQGTPAPLRRHLSGHSVDTLVEKGWAEKDNGELLDLAEREGYEVLVTTDQSLPHQRSPCRMPTCIALFFSERCLVNTILGKVMRERRSSGQ